MGLSVDDRYETKIEKPQCLVSLFIIREPAILGTDGITIKNNFTPNKVNAELAHCMDHGEKLQARIIGLTESEDPMERIVMGFYPVKI